MRRVNTVNYQRNTYRQQRQSNCFIHKLFNQMFLISLAMGQLKNQTDHKQDEEYRK